MRCKQELLSNMCFAPLGDLLAEPLRNGLTKPKAVRGDGVKMIGMGEIFANSRIGSISMARVPVTEKELSNNCIKKGDILFARQSLALEGAGKCAIVIDVTEETVFESHLIRARIDSSKANPYFVYYYFNSYAGKENIKTIVEQVAAAGIRGSDLIRLNVPCPDIETQNKIAAILSALDEKIAINREINDNLEQQAMALYRQMFVETNNDARRECRADEYFDISIGKTPPRKEAQWFSMNPIDCIWVSISDMGRCGMYIADSSEYLTHESVDKFNIKVVPDNTVLLSFKLTVGRVAITDGAMATNEAIAHFKTDKPEINEYLYCYLKDFNYQTMGSTSSIATAVNSKIIKAMPFVAPTDAELVTFHSATAPMFEMIKTRQRENTRLAELRDSLLPKLMSGEIDVSAVQL